MKILKDEHPVEQAIQEVENILNTYNLTITYLPGGLCVIDKNGIVYQLVNVGGMSATNALPRAMDEDKFAIKHSVSD